MINRRSVDSVPSPVSLPLLSLPIIDASLSSAPSSLSLSLSLDLLSLSLSLSLPRSPSLLSLVTYPVISVVVGEGHSQAKFRIVLLADDLGAELKAIKLDHQKGIDAAKAGEKG